MWGGGVDRGVLVAFALAVLVQVGLAAETWYLSEEVERAAVDLRQRYRVDPTDEEIPIEETRVEGLGSEVQQLTILGDGVSLALMLGALVALQRDEVARRAAERERDRVIADLQQALAQVHQLSGMLPICAWCKKIRDDDGYWSEIEAYVARHSDAEFTHGICPDCKAQVEKEYRARRT